MNANAFNPTMSKFLALFSGRIEAQEKAAKIPLAAHFEAYKSMQIAHGISKARIKSTGSKLRRVVADCGWQALADFNGAQLEDWLNKQVANGMSLGNRQSWRVDLGTFCNWCVRTQRLFENPFATVPYIRAKNDPARQRRAFTEAELLRLFRVARWRPLAEYGRQSEPRTKGRSRSKHARRTWQYADVTYDTLDAAVAIARQRLKYNRKFCRQLDDLGFERQLIYKTLALTGLRRGELASLTVGQFTLDGQNPCVKLRKSDEKNRQGNSIPLRADLVAEIRQWLDHKRKTSTVNTQTRVFSVPQHLLKALNRDLRLAGIPKRDPASGRTVDVHSFRYTFATMMSTAGVAPRVAQAAMRHSTIDLTMNVYTDERLLDVCGALTALPALPLQGSLTYTPSERKDVVRKSQIGLPIAATDPAATSAPQAAEASNGNNMAHALRGLSTDDVATLMRFAKALSGMAVPQ